MIEFYSTSKYESKLKNKYVFYIKKKQEELDEIYKRNRKLQKLTAYGYISKPDRVFCVEEDGSIYCEDVNPENICPIEKIEGGEKYILDSNFEYYVNIFISKYKRYKVIFSPDGKYGPTCYYSSSIGAVPARMESYDGEVLIVDDESKYDISVA